MKTSAHPGGLPPGLPSDRKFGWTFTAAFAFFGLFHPWLLAVAAVTAAVTLTHDEWLRPLNRGWMTLGELLHHVVSPLVLGILFFAVFTPMGQAMRLFGWDAMKRTLDPQARTYWTRRDPPGPADDSFTDLF